MTYLIGDAGYIIGVLLLLGGFVLGYKYRSREVDQLVQFKKEAIELWEHVNHIDETALHSMHNGMVDVRNWLEHVIKSEA